MTLPSQSAGRTEDAPDIPTLAARLEAYAELSTSEVFEQWMWVSQGFRDAAKALLELEDQRGTLMAYSDGRNTTLTPLGEIIDKMEKSANIARSHTLLAENCKLKGQLEEAVGALEKVCFMIEHGWISPDVIGDTQEGWDKACQAYRDSKTYEMAKELLSKLKEAGS